MKSFKQLVMEPQFGLFLAVAMLLIGWNLAYGSFIFGIIMFVVIFGLIFLNVWKTREKK